jgi:hypothetical protein
MVVVKREKKIECADKASLKGTRGGGKRQTV